MKKEQYGLYSQTLESLPESEMSSLVRGISPEISFNEMGKVFSYKAGEFQIVCSQMKKELILQHLSGFVGYVTKVCSESGVEEEYWEELKAKILATRLVLGVEITIARENDKVIDEFMGALCYGIKPLMFYQNDIYNPESRLLLSSRGYRDANVKI